MLFLVTMLKHNIFLKSGFFSATDSCRDGRNVRKGRESVDVIMKNWLYIGCL